MNGKRPGEGSDADEHPPGYDPELFARNLSRLLEETGRAVAAYLRPREREGRLADAPGDSGDAVRVLGGLGAALFRNPLKLLDAQRRLWADYADLWVGTARRMAGGVAKAVIEPEDRDRRFKDREWSENPVFDFLKQSYLITSRWARELVDDADNVDEATRRKAEFYIRQILSAVSPSNFVPTNPELLRRTIETSAENLVRGMHMLAEDIEAGHGDLKIRQVDPKSFEVGKNLAATPGKVILQNEVCQVIQYQGKRGARVLKRPLVIVPPWINKFYILDLTPEKSFIRWCVEQGHTVFLISWVNPDSRQSTKSFGDYINEGVFAALGAIEAITGEREVNAVGYCVGGTLLAAAMAYMAVKRDRRIASATFFAAQVDFTEAGDLKIFAEEDAIRETERRMEAHGYLEGSQMAASFNMLRPDDLIWPYIVNDYLMGNPPGAFDLLYWNADSTRMPAANHSFYLRQCYLENRLARGEMEIGGVTLDLGKVRTPAYSLAAREDHIAPARSVYAGLSLFGGPVTFVVGGSGHVAGVINPPAKGKYQYWTDGEGSDFDRWMETATEHPGSWWPHWQTWIEAQDDTLVPARKVGGNAYPPIEDAPGSYVKVRS